MFVSVKVFAAAGVMLLPVSVSARRTATEQNCRRLMGLVVVAAEQGSIEQIVVEREVHIAFSPGAGLGGGLLREREGAGIQLGGVQRLRFLPLQGGVGFRLILREGHSRAGGVNIP